VDLFVFHQTMEGGWRPTVRPPRLGGNARMGVFATRSTFRPNPIGMSLVELKGIRCQKDQVILELGSLDLVDGTPVVDIKPICPLPKRCRMPAPATRSRHRRRKWRSALRQKQKPSF
jgi:tRNA-Thr(GGU) m(6)t(6)A37 methyltransferase TsaA